MTMESTYNQTHTPFVVSSIPVFIGRNYATQMISKPYSDNQKARCYGDYINIPAN